MNTDAQTTKLRVLFVTDFAYWVTATIARQIARHNPWIEPTICSQFVLPELMRRSGHLADFIDLAHFMTPHNGTLFLPEFEGRVPCVTTIHHVEDHRSVEAEVYSDAVMTVCHQWHEHLVSIGVDRSKLVCVRNGVETEQFRPAELAERAKLRARLGLPQDALVVGFSAKRTSDTHNRKGTDVLLEAITALRRELPQVACLIIGPGWSDVVARQVEQGGICLHLPFILERDDLADIYRSLDMYWVTARIEGGPVPLLEAMSSGICCITTPVGIAPELVRDGENAFLAPIDDADTFVQKTAALAADAGLRNRMAQAARRTILESYRWEQTTRSATTLYATAIERFGQRFPQAVAPRLPGRAAYPPTRAMDELSAVPANLKPWVRAMEDITFMRSLQEMGATREASILAFRALRHRPWDRQIWSEAGPNSPFSALYRGSRTFYRALKKLAGNPARVTQTDR